MGPKWVTVGQTSATTGGHTQRLIFTKAAESALGVGFSTTGDYGTYKASGTQSWKSTSSVSFPAHSTAGTRLMQTQYTYGRVLCTVPVTQAKYYRVVPLRYDSGSRTVSATTPSATHCTTFEAGSKWEKDTTTAVTYSNGVEVGKAIGLDLSARTGWSSNLRNEFTFSSKRQLCGAKSTPPNNSGQLVVKAP